MLGRLSSFSRINVSVRRLSVFDKFMNDPKVKEKAAEMMANPAAMSDAMSKLSSALKDGGGGGMTGMLLRSAPVKSAIDKMGGIENLERMMKDPAAMEMMQNMMKNPEMMAKATANMENMFKENQELPDSKTKK